MIEGVELNIYLDDDTVSFSLSLYKQKLYLRH